MCLHMQSRFGTGKYFGKDGEFFCTPCYSELHMSKCFACEKQSPGPSKALCANLFKVSETNHWQGKS